MNQPFMQNVNIDHSTRVSRKRNLKDNTMRKSLMLIFTLFITLDYSLADESQNPSKEDLILVLEKIEKILQEKDYEKFRNYYPQFIEMFVKFWKQMQQEQSKELNSKDERWENAVDLPEVATGDDNSSAAVLRFISAWLNNDVKRKRGYHRALCHFKICNMGSKRSNTYWDQWRNNQQ